MSLSPVCLIVNAFLIWEVQEAIRQVKDDFNAKDLGRLDELKDGYAKAAMLTPERQIEIAKKVAQVGLGGGSKPTAV